MASTWANGCMRLRWHGQHRDPALRQKLDYVAAELVKCQLADGYLGTYLDNGRWTRWTCGRTSTT